MSDIDIPCLKVYSGFIYFSLIKWYKF